MLACALALGLGAVGCGITRETPAEEMSEPVDEATADQVAEDLEDDVTASIPEGAYAIKIYSGSPATEAFEAAGKALLDRGFNVYRSNPDQLTLTTEYADVGENTALAIDLFAHHTPGGSVVRLQGDYGEPTSKQYGSAAPQGAAPSDSVTIAQTDNVDEEGTEQTILGVEAGRREAENATWGSIFERSSIAFGALAMLVEEMDEIERDSIQYVVGQTDKR